MHYPDFLTAVARDGRSYNHTVFSEAGNQFNYTWIYYSGQLLLRTQLISAEDHKKYESFLSEVAKIAEDQAITEAALGEIPDEFLGIILGLLSE